MDERTFRLAVLRFSIFLVEAKENSPWFVQLRKETKPLIEQVLKGSKSGFELSQKIEEFLALDNNVPNQRLSVETRTQLLNFKSFLQGNF
jgi:hypothetical protein